MGDEQVAQSLFRLQVVEQAKHLVLHQHVQCGDGLVADDHIRIEGHGARDGDALPLAAGKLVRITAHHRFRQFHHVDELAHTLGTALLVSDAVDAQRLLDGPVDGVHGVERSVRVLEHRLHMTSEVKQLLALESGDVFAVVGDGAGGRLKQFQHHVGHGGFAGTGFADDGQCGALLDGEAHIVDRLEHLLLARQLEFLGQVIHRDDGFTLLQGILVHRVLHDRGGVAAMFLDGDDALRCQGRRSGDQTLGVRMLRMLQHFQ